VIEAFLLFLIWSVFLICLTWQQAQREFERDLVTLWHVKPSLIPLWRKAQEVRRWEHGLYGRARRAWRRFRREIPWTH
jgi:hypothetical protein